MIRKVAITLLSTASVGALLLTLMSYCGCPGFRWTFYDGQVDRAMPAPRITLFFWDIYRSDPAVLTIQYRQVFAFDQLPGEKRLDFGILQVQTADSSAYTGARRHEWFDWYISTPLWFIALVFGAYPMVAFVRGPFRRYRRRQKGLCLKCGYNLTDNVSGICSECGERT